MKSLLLLLLLFSLDVFASRIGPGEFLFLRPVAAPTNCKNGQMMFDISSLKVKVCVSGVFEELGGSTIKGSTPTLTFIDEDTTDEDDSAKLLINCTDTGSGTEDCDVDFIAQEAGVEKTYMSYDASADQLKVNQNIDMPTGTRIGLDTAGGGENILFNTAVNVVVGGTAKYQFQATQFVSINKIATQVGLSSTLPDWLTSTTDTDTGVGSDAADSLVIITGGATRLQASNAGVDVIGALTVNTIPVLTTASTTDVESFSSADTLDGDNDVALCDSSGGTFAITLPTAVAATGKIYDIIKTEGSAISVTINTTSSQTIGGRASGAIGLNRLNDRLRVISDGSNWEILEKTETEVLQGFSITSFSDGSNADYLSASCDITLTEGIWNLRAQFAVNKGSGTGGIGLHTTTGIFSADGADSGTIPALLSAGTNVDSVEGDAIFTNFNSSFISLPSTLGVNERWYAGLIGVVVSVSGGTETVFAVPNIALGTAGTSTVSCVITAERSF